MKSVVKETGEVITSGFACYRSFEGEKDFDKYYIDRVVKQVVNKVGETEDDYILVDKVIETKRDIKQFINSQADQAGIEAYLKPYEMTGTSIPNVTVDQTVQDFTQFPDNLADACLLGEKAKKTFKNLDADLTKGMTYDDFMSKFTQADFDAYISQFKKEKETISVEKKEEVK